MVSTPTLPWKFQNWFQSYQASSPFRPAGSFVFEAPAFSEGAVSPSLLGLLVEQPHPQGSGLPSGLHPPCFGFPTPDPLGRPVLPNASLREFRLVMGPTTLLPPIFKSFHWPRRRCHPSAGLMTGQARFPKHPATEA